MKKTTNMIIRQASLNDMDTLLAFEQKVVEAERNFDPTIKKENTKYYDIEKMIGSPDVEIVVAESANEIIGSGYARIKDAEPFLAHQKYAYLGFMYVVPQYRGIGVNKSIVDVLKQWAISRDIFEIRLEVYQANEAAINAYQKAGFIKHMIEMRMPAIELPGDLDNA